jgi:hypothetical protein
MNVKQIFSCVGWWWRTQRNRKKDRQTDNRKNAFSHLTRVQNRVNWKHTGRRNKKRNETKRHEGRFGFFVKDTWLVGLKSSRVLNWGSPLAPGQKLTPRLMIHPFCTIGQQLSVLNLTSKKKQLARLFKDFFCRELDITFFSEVWVVWRRLVFFATFFSLLILGGELNARQHEI